MEDGDSKVDILHPLATLHYEHCHSWNVEVEHCVVLHDIVAVLERKVGVRDRLHVSSTSLNSWTVTSLSHHGMSLATYQSKLVVAGGCHPSTYELTDQVLTSTIGEDWQSSLPPMPTKRYETSAVSAPSSEALVVAGGRVSNGRGLDVVEVLLGHQWNTTYPLPSPCYGIRSTFHDNNFYFTGQIMNQVIHTCSCAALIKSCQTSNEATTTSQAWMKISKSIDTLAIFSYSSQLIGISSSGTMRVYSSAMESWIGDASEYYWKDKYITQLAAAVLPTEGFLFAYKHGVCRVKISVATFDPDSRFIYNALSRLEAVMGVKIVSVLAEVCYQLTTASEVQLQPRVNPISVTAWPDPKTNPCQYVEEVISQWSEGRSPRPPTWRELLHVLQDIGELELRQQIENFMKGAHHELNGEERYLDACHHFIDTKESLDIPFLKLLLLGPPRLGKTTLCRRLMGEIVDLKSAGEAEHVQPSTGAVESGHVVVRNVSNTTALLTQSEWSAVKSLQEEACILFCSLMSTIENKISVSPVASKANDATFHSQSMKTVGESTSSQSINPSLPLASRMVQQLTPAIPSSSTISSFQKGIPEVVAMVKEAMGSQYWKDVKHMFKAFLRVEDAGGQPELMDMLPALTIGPGIYFLFINLQNDLDHHYNLTYCNTSGVSTPPVESIYSVKDMLLSSLSSISCSNSSTSVSGLGQEESTIPDISNIFKSFNSVAYIVGTHKDKVSKDHIRKMNKELQKVIESTDFYDFVEFFSEEELIVAMDNMEGGFEEVKKIQSLLEKSIYRRFKELKIPAVWFIFSLILRKKNDRTATIEECMVLSEALHMSSYETKVALWFLHHHAGVMMYFPDVPELKGLVIIDTQVVYDSVTILILRAMSFDKVGHKEAHEFKNTGKFMLSCIIAATSEISGDYIPAHKLVALLEYLHIIARISAQQHSPSLASSSEEHTTYIMPCVLKNATKEELDSFSKKPHELCPIMVHFKCGFVPIGTFPTVIACLIANKSFILIHEGIWKNIVQFRYGSSYTLLTFISCPTYYEVIISKFCNSKIEQHVECASIRREIESTLNTASSRMNYGSFMDYQFAFECPIYHENNQKHVCVVDRAEGVPDMMLCLYSRGNPEPVELGSEHKVWFGQELSSTQIAPSKQEDSDALQSHSIADLYSRHLKDLPSAAHRYLNKTVDWDQDNVDTDLYKIARYMIRWVYLAPQLGLDDIDVGDIKQDHRAAKEQSCLGIPHLLLSLLLCISAGQSHLEPG